jgi:hypothetical protein
LTIDWILAANVARALAALAAVVGALFAYTTYRRSVKTRRAEWLASLHEKFFESDRYATIRRVLDYQEQPVLAQLTNAVHTETHHPLVDEFYRYLNFFELLASLRELGQISRKEILKLFEYDLRLITKHQFIMKCLKQQGFERLPVLLRKTGLAPRG